MKAIVLQTVTIDLLLSLKEEDSYGATRYAA